MPRHLSLLIIVVLTLGVVVAGVAAESAAESSDIIASLTLQPLGQCQDRLGSQPIMADLTGRMMFERGRPGRGGMIPVEFVELRLVGGGNPDPGQIGGGNRDPSDSFFDVWVMLDPNRISMGQLAGPGKGPVVDSFFDVLFDIAINASTPRLMLYPTGPVHLMATGGGLLETRFELVANGSVRFLLPPTGTHPPSPCVELTAMALIPVSPSAAIIKRELIQIEKKLNRLLRPVEPPPPCDASACPTGQ